MKGTKMSYLVNALAQADQLERMMIEAEGQLTPEIEAMLAISEKQMSEVVDVYHLRMERMEKVAEFYSAKADQYARLASSIEKATKYTKQLIKDHMMNVGVTELSGGEFSFKLARTAPVVDVVDQDKIPDTYIKVKVEETVDKKKIADDLKLGIQIEGVILKENYSLRTSIKKG